MMMMTQSVVFVATFVLFVLQVIITSVSASSASALALATTTNSKYADCSEIFVGGGWAGVYSFYRRVMEDPQTVAPKACLFEQSWRIGGRTYSVAVNHSTAPFVQDVGAYRFSPDMHLPGDLIMKELNLSTECYQKTCPNAKEDFPNPFMFNYSAPLRRVVDPITKLPSGYATPIHEMIARVKALGARVFTQTSLVEMNIVKDENDADGTGISMKFKNGLTGKTFDITNPSLVILNLPRNRLFDVANIDKSLSVPMVDTLKCIVFDMPPDLFSGFPPIEGETLLLKAYMYFQDAFWYTKLNQTVGSWPPENEFFARLTKEGVRFNIRWHDGPVQCKTNDDSKTTCEGMLETYYSLSNETFYSSLAPSPEEPLGSIWKTDGPEAEAKLKLAHEGLIDILTPLLEEHGYDTSDLDATDIIAQPVGLIVGVWRRPWEEHPLGVGYTAPTKVYYAPEISGTPDRACGVPGLTEDTYRETVLRPWGPKIPIFLMNNDWSCENVRYFWGDWAEESLLQAERAMYYLGMKKPDWLNATYYQTKVLSKVMVVDESIENDDENVDDDGESIMTLWNAERTKQQSQQQQSEKPRIVWIVISVMAVCLLTLVGLKRYQHYKDRGGKDYTTIP